VLIVTGLRRMSQLCRHRFHMMLFLLVGMMIALSFSVLECVGCGGKRPHTREKDLIVLGQQ
jgi:hypothetical protein